MAVLLGTSGGARGFKVSGTGATILCESGYRYRHPEHKNKQKTRHHFPHTELHLLSGQTDKGAFRPIDKVEKRGDASQIKDQSHSRMEERLQHLSWITSQRGSSQSHGKSKKGDNSCLIERKHQQNSARIGSQPSGQGEASVIEAPYQSKGEEEEKDPFQSRARFHYSRRQHLMVKKDGVRHFVTNIHAQSF